VRYIHFSGCKNQLDRTLGYLKNNKIRKGKVLFYPLPWAAYLPLFAFVKKAIAMPPKTAPAIADAPNTPSAAKPSGSS
jgi:hypothetical protein